jgi:hypothetical protein
MREISEELGCKPMVIPTAQPGYAEYMDKDVEMQRPAEQGNRSTGISLALGRQQTLETDKEGDSVDQRLQFVAERLKDELGNEEDDDNDDNGDEDVRQDDEQEAEKVGASEGNQDKTAKRPSLKLLTEETNTPSVPSSGRTTPDEPGMSGTHADAEVSYTTANPTAAQSSTNVGTTKLTPAAQKEYPSATPLKQGRCIRSLRHVFNKFAADQHTILSQALISGRLHGSDDSLRIAEPMPSLRETYNYRYVPSSAIEAEGRFKHRARKRRRRQWMEADGVEGSYPGSGVQTPVGTPISAKGKELDKEEFYEILREKTEKEQKSDAVSTASHHSLTRVYSFVFALE